MPQAHRRTQTDDPAHMERDEIRKIDHYALALKDLVR
jgi:hypothetical protein